MRIKRNDNKKMPLFFVLFIADSGVMAISMLISVLLAIDVELAKTFSRNGKEIPLTARVTINAATIRSLVNLYSKMQ